MEVAGNMRLLVFGAGYSGCAVARAARAAGIETLLATRDPSRAELPDGVERVRFEAAPIGRATHLLLTASPETSGDPASDDPVLALHGATIAAAAPAWVGYLSTIGVYGDRGGAWVDEGAEPRADAPRAARRIAVEAGWAALRAGRPLDLIRLAGIYGPGRSVLDDLRAGRARRVVAPGHAFNRIHRDDIAALVLAAASRPEPGAPRVLHGADDEPAESAAVIEEAARLLGVAPPDTLPLDAARATMSPMARSFWDANRRVSAARTKAALGLAWRHPTYREGLRAILAEERAEGRGDQREVGRA